MDNQIADALRNLRMQHNMSQEALAESLNVSRQAISNWENGKTKPDADMLIKISSIFQVSLDEMISGGCSGDLIQKNKRGLIVCVAGLTLSMVHLVLAIMGKVNIIGVFISVILAAVVSIIMYFAFESSIKNNDFSMIAGYMKSDSSNFPRFVRQLRTMNSIAGILALALNILYIPIYYTSRALHMKVSLIYLVVFIIGLITDIIIVNHKYRKSE